MHVHDTIGQLFMVGIPGPTLDIKTRVQLLDLRPGGVILFRRNYTAPEQLASLCAELHALFPDSPLLIGLDHEGGRVHRLSPPFTRFPPAAAIGQMRNIAIAQQIGRAMGEELSSVGIDINFTPVLDVLTNPTNTVIGDRAFASDPHLVGQFGCAQARGLREGGVIPCGKHFPGHGATQLDSHEDLPRDNRALDALLHADLQPFRLAIAAGIEMIMAAHVVYPALDAEYPASQSTRIIEGLLRQQLDYHGVVATDDLEMGAIVRHGSVAHASLQALCAGADLLLICHKIELALAARELCLQALSDGRLPLTRIEQAQHRLAKMKEAHARQPRAERGVIGSRRHQQLAEAIVREAAEQA